MGSVHNQKIIYIISHSSIDLVSVLNLYEKYRSDHEVKILISSTAENLQFLQSVNIPPRALRFIYFKSRYNKNKKNLIRFIYQLLSEKKKLDQIIGEIKANTNNELFFHSYDNDYQMGYLVAQVAKTNPTTLVDTLGIKPKPLGFHDLLTLIGIKHYSLFVAINLIFGRHFILSGNRSYPMISLKLRPIKMDVVPRMHVFVTRELSKYRYLITKKGVNIIFNYAEPFGISEKKHFTVNKGIIDCLSENRINIFIKLHPNSSPPFFFNGYDLHYIPKYIPFEFVDLTNISLVIGIQGASLLCTGTVMTISFVKMIYHEDSDFYKSAMNQMSMNKDIKFISSVDELSLIIKDVCT